MSRCRPPCSCFVHTSKRNTNFWPTKFPVIFSHVVKTCCSIPKSCRDIEKVHAHEEFRLLWCLGFNDIHLRQHVLGRCAVMHVDSEAEAPQTAFTLWIRHRIVVQYKLQYPRDFTFALGVLCQLKGVFFPLTNLPLPLRGQQDEAQRRPCQWDKSWHGSGIGETRALLPLQPRSQSYPQEFQRDGIPDRAFYVSNQGLLWGRGSRGGSRKSGAATVVPQQVRLVRWLARSGWVGHCAVKCTRYSWYQGFRVCRRLREEGGRVDRRLARGATVTDDEGHQQKAATFRLRLSFL